MKHIFILLIINALISIPIQLSGQTEDNCASPINLPDTTNYVDRDFIVSVLDINASGNNVKYVEPGSQVSFRIVWNSVYVGPTCPDCVQQFYIGVDDDASFCLISAFTGQADRSGDDTFTFMAPMASGTYYFKSDQSLQLGCTLPTQYPNTMEGALGAIIIDAKKPFANCRDAIVAIGPSGSGTIEPARVNRRSSDDCGIDTMYLSKDEFVQADTGSFDVKLFVQDYAGNLDSCTSTLTIQLDKCMHVDLSNINTESAFNAAITCFNQGVGNSTMILTDSIILTDDRLTISNNLDTLTIKGKGYNIDATHSGRALFIGEASKVVMDSLIIKNSRDTTFGGGGILVNAYSFLKADHCTFDNNISEKLGGGGLFNNSESVMILSNCTFTNNAGKGVAHGGGGIFNNRGHIQVINCSFRSNTSTETGTVGGGGAIYNNFGEAEFTNCTFENNTADVQGSTIGGGGGAIYNNFGNLHIQNTTIHNNQALGAGGGVCNFYGSVTVMNSTLAHNQATETGGGVYDYRGNFNILNSTISYNSAHKSGGGIHSEGVTSLEHVTLTKNIAPSGSGIASTDNQTDTVHIAASIIAGNVNSPDLFIINGGHNRNPFNIINDNVIGIMGPNITTTGVNNDTLVTDIGIDTVLTANGGFTKTLKLLPNSIAIDKAVTTTTTTTTDQRGAGHKRQMNGYADAGAFEVNDCISSYTIANGNRLVNTQHPTANFETNGVIESSQLLQLNINNVSATEVHYDSKTEIILGSGFEVQSGVVFNAVIDGCDGAP